MSKPRKATAKPWDPAPPVMGPETEAARAARLAQYAAEDRNIDGVPNDWFRSTAFVEYDPATGAIRAAGRMALAALAKIAAETGRAFLPQAGDGEASYVDLATLTVAPKTPCPAVLTGTTLTNVPVPSTVTVRLSGDVVQSVALTDPADTTVEFTFDLPGTYTLTVTSARHLPGSYTVTV